MIPVEIVMIGEERLRYSLCSKTRLCAEAGPAKLRLDFLVDRAWRCELKWVVGAISNAIANHRFRQV